MSLNVSAATTRDLWYLPAQGQFKSETELGYGNTEAEIDVPGTSKVKNSKFVGAETLSYAITNEFQIGAQVAFASEKTKNGAGVSDSASGITDPVIGALYRILKQEDSALYLDAFLAVGPSLGKSKSSNVLRGSTEIEAKVSIGQNNGVFEYAVVPTISYFTDQKVESDTIKSRVDFGLGVETQYDFNEVVSLNGSLGLTLPGKLKEKTSGEEIKYDYIVDLEVGPSFQILENLSAGVAVNYAYGTGEYTLGGTADYTERSLAITGGLDFVF